MFSTISAPLSFQLDQRQRDTNDECSPEPELCLWLTCAIPSNTSSLKAASFLDFTVRYLQLPVHFQMTRVTFLVLAILLDWPKCLLFALPPQS